MIDLTYYLVVLEMTVHSENGTILMVLIGVQTSATP